MTDITALAAELKVEALNSASLLGYISQFDSEDIDGDNVDLRFEDEYGNDTGCDISITQECENASKIIKALVEALEAAEQRVTELQLRHEIDPRTHKIIDLEEKVAELEARTIKPVNGEVLVTVSGFTGCGKSAIAGEIEIAMKAIGVPVQWTNGDAEKRMTGADWLSAIEMYKPNVRIVEVNIPRAAGIKLQIEGE